MSRDRLQRTAPLPYSRSEMVTEGWSDARTCRARPLDSYRDDRCFVSAYRGCPELIVSLLEDRQAHDDLSVILSTVGDAEPTSSRSASPSTR